MLNLLEGHTHAEDEQVIITVMKDISACRIVELIQMANKSVTDFDDEVDGSEWDELVLILLNVIAQCPGGLQQT
jgi:hypothetical protein